LIGYVELSEADAFLEYQVGAEEWNDLNRYSKKTGTISSDGVTDVLLGVGTTFIEDLQANEGILIDGEALRVLSIDSDTQAKLEVKKEIPSGTELVVLTESETNSLIDLVRRKKVGLMSAFREIKNNPKFEIPDSPSEDELEALKNAQCVRALEIFTDPTNQTSLNHASNVSSYKAGDFAVTYKKNERFNFSDSVLFYLEQFRKGFEIVQTFRSGPKWAE